MPVVPGLAVDLKTGGVASPYGFPGMAVLGLNTGNVITPLPLPRVLYANQVVALGAGANVVLVGGALNVIYWVKGVAISASVAGRFTIDFTSGSVILTLTLLALTPLSISLGDFGVSYGEQNVGIRLTNNTAGAVTYELNIYGFYTPFNPTA